MTGAISDFKNGNFYYTAVVTLIAKRNEVNSFVNSIMHSSVLFHISQYTCSVIRSIFFCFEEHFFEILNRQSIFHLLNKY